MDKQLLDSHISLRLSDYNQIFQGMYFHPEGGGDFFVNEGLQKIKEDLDNIDNLLIKTGNSINELMMSTMSRLERVKTSIVSEKERRQDIMMLCNNYTDFDNITTIKDISFTGAFTTINDVTFSAKEKKSTKANIEIKDVVGNGYPGNEYVYMTMERDMETGQFQLTVIDAADPNQMIDNSDSTYYEYSRINYWGLEEINNVDFNKDSEFAKCTVSFSTDIAVNYIKIKTEETGLVVSRIQYSMEDGNYKTVNQPNIVLNDKLESYNHFNYIFGSDVIQVPYGKFFKITFEAKQNRSDLISYEVTEDVSVTDIPENVKTTKVVSDAKRSIIRINNLEAYNNTYVQNSRMESSELLHTQAYSIALYCNCYLPEGLYDQNIKFTLSINGDDYDVVPINSNMNGTKIIRFSGGKSNTMYTELINEVIKSARLTIHFKGNAGLTPFVNNIKILIGGEI